MLAVVPLGVSCSLSCRFRDIRCGPLEHWGAGRFSSRHSATGGRRAMRARLVFWRCKPPLRASTHSLSAGDIPPSIQPWVASARLTDTEEKDGKLLPSGGR